jgi:hypothetical protein
MEHQKLSIRLRRITHQGAWGVVSTWFGLGPRIITTQREELVEGSHDFTLHSASTTL